MEKDRPSSTLWRNNNSHIIENQCGLGIGKHGERGSACWLNVNCTICNYNLYNLLLQFWICSFCIFTSSKINAGWGFGKHGWWKRRWASRFDDSPLLFVLLLCICLVAQCWLLLLSSSSQSLWHVLEEFASFWSKLMIHHCSWSCLVTSSQESSLF